MRALLLGIKLARNMELTQVIFETDSLFVMTAIIRRPASISYLKRLLEEVLNLLHLPDWKASVCHYFRETNCCTDFLAHKGHNGPFFVVSFNSINSLLDILLKNDCNGPSFIRLVR
jgi:predicted LPLAT superfamily acyltransferase